MLKEGLFKNCSKPLCLEHLTNGICQVCIDAEGELENQKEELLEILEESYDLKSFFTSEKLKDIPFFKIQDEIVPLPFTKSVFEMFKPSYEKSPFGRGEETIYDDAFRNSYDFSKEKIVLSQN